MEEPTPYWEGGLSAESHLPRGNPAPAKSCLHRVRIAGRGLPLESLGFSPLSWGREDNGPGLGVDGVGFPLEPPDWDCFLGILKWVGSAGWLPDSIRWAWKDTVSVSVEAFITAEHLVCGKGKLQKFHLRKQKRETGVTLGWREVLDQQSVIVQANLCLKLVGDASEGCYQERHQLNGVLDGFWRKLLGRRRKYRRGVLPEGLAMLLLLS